MKIDINAQAIADKIEKRVKRVQFILDQKVAADSNLFAPEDEGFLKDSVLTGSDFGSGKLHWNVLYAKKLYYSSFIMSKDKNPNAMPKWFEEAKYRYIKGWEALANAQYNQ
jgi:hypothetical protein